MEKLLSICIPTFNRAQILSRQLAWLFQEVQDFSTECEIIVSDNCSSDNTPSVVEKWKSASPAAFHFNRNSENLGWLRNFAYCLNAANGRYTWIIGDDDVVYEGAVAEVITTLKSRPDLSLFYLNFCERHAITQAFNPDPWFKDVEEDAKLPDSKAIFQKHLEDNIGSVIFISATIFRTQFGREAYQSWQDSTNNWAGLAYWNGYCATKGNVLVTEKTFLECTLGVSYWQKDPKAWFKIRHSDIPEVYAKLYEIGYPRKFCQKMILKILEEDLITEKPLKNIKYFLWCFRKAPRWTSKMTIAYFRFLLFCTFDRGEIRGSAEMRMLKLSNAAEKVADSQ
jgi:glycosyltransferase involved in cell wall biosynthesis